VISGPAGSVFRNRWRDVASDQRSSWQPSKTVSVIVPAYNNQAPLNLMLASLAAQDYPQDLFAVVVVDDNSETPLELPDVRPANTRIHRPSRGWGRANAVHEGILNSSGQVVIQLDSDLILDRGHISAHLKMHDAYIDVATKGDIAFIDSWPDSATTIRRAAEEGTLDELFATANHEEQWVERVFAETDDLNDGGDRIFSTLTGATCSMSRDLYERAGGMRTDLRLGEDTDLAYRLAQRGAVFVPCRDARSYHLGLSNVHVRPDDVKDYNQPFYAQEIPLFAEARMSTGRQWAVPLVRVVVQINAEEAPLARACIDRILSSTAEDLEVDLVGPWDELADDRRNVLVDPLRDLHAVAEWYRHESRVRLLEERPSSAFPSPFELQVPVQVAVGRTTITTLVRAIRKRNLGVLDVPVPFAEGASLKLWRTAAVERAATYWPEKPAHTMAAEVWGGEKADATEIDLLDLLDLNDPRRLASRINWGRDNGEARLLKAEIRRLNAQPKPRATLARRALRRLRRMLS